MSSLADLFVTYESAGRHRASPSTDTEGQSDYDIIDAAKSRLERIQEAQTKRGTVVTEDSHDESPVVVPSTPGTESNFSNWFIAPSEAISRQPAKPVTSARAPYSGAELSYDLNRSISRYSRGNLAQEIEELFSKNGINITVTSGQRDAGKAGKAGNRSHHVKGNAVDIVPGDGETFGTIRTKMVNSPEILQFFHDNGLGVIDETTSENMRKTGAIGKHYHIGPDRWALNTWANWTGTAGIPGGDVKQDWTRNLYNAYHNALKKEYGKQYDENTYTRIATYMTYQSALESGYGQNANGYNYAGHMKNGKTVHYSTLDSFVNAHIKTLKKWDIMSAKSLQDYIDKLYQGQYQYNPSQSPDEYYAAVNGTVDRVNGYLALSAKFGGKFTDLRQLYEQNFSKYRR